MNEKYAEKISMLMDDELPATETVKLTEGMKHDPDLRRCWERYHLVSDALKNNLPFLVHHDLAHRVSQALQSEPLYNLPAPKSAKVYHGLKPAIGLALAASVAAVTFILAPWESSTLNPAVPQDQQAALDVPAVAVQAPLALATTSAAQAAVTAVPATVVEVSGGNAVAAQQAPRELKVEPRLYGYLVDHNVFTDIGAVQGTMLPYVRIVGYSPHMQQAR